MTVPLSNPMFCQQFNLKAALRGKPGRISFDASSQLFMARSDADSLYFCQRKRARKYRDGIGKRIGKLAHTYFLPRIPFETGDVVIDCGANIGELALYFRGLNRDIRYIGIEPSPVEFRCLQRNAAFGESHNLGLWHSDGQLDFYVSSKGADSSLIKPPHYDEVIRVPTKRLDALVDAPIKLFKLEAEGAEPEVLAGCEGLLGRIQYITADLGFERGVEQTSTLAPVLNTLVSHGFELVDMSHERVVALFRNKALTR